MSKRKARARRTDRAPTPPAPKPTAATLVDRVGEVLDLIKRGKGSRREVLRYAAENWGIAERTVDDYLARARAELRDMQDADIVDVRAEVVAWHRDVYSSAREGGDLKSALAAGRELAKLLDLYPKQDQPTPTDAASQVAELIAQGLGLKVPNGKPT